MANAQIIQLIAEIVEDIIGIAGIIIIPYVIKALKATEKKAKIVIGYNNYNYAKEYIESEYKLHKDLFTENNITSFLESLDNKFGDRLSKDTIKRIVDLVAIGVDKTQ